MTLTISLFWAWRPWKGPLKKSHLLVTRKSTWPEDLVIWSSRPGAAPGYFKCGLQKSWDDLEGVTFSNTHQFWPICKLHWGHFGYFLIFFLIFSRFRPFLLSFSFFFLKMIESSFPLAPRFFVIQTNKISWFFEIFKKSYIFALFRVKSWKLRFFEFYLFVLQKKKNFASRNRKRVKIFARSMNESRQISRETHSKGQLSATKTCFWNPPLAR